MQARIYSMLPSYTMRSAISMIELVFVIVILGIVSSIGADIIANTYESYIVQRAQYKATTKTELALNQIANRLRYVIPGTVVFRASKDSGFKRITDTTAGNDKVLQWVSYDGDSFEAIESSSNRNPGWSGFCDIGSYTSGSTSLSTPGSNLDLTTTVINNLGGDIGDAVLYFPDGSNYGIASGSDESITLDAAIPLGNRIFERYKLAWSSYALSCENGTTEYPCGDLVLYYNFSPVVGAALPENGKILLKKVSNFRFKGGEESMRIKICKTEKISDSETIHACKEKVIF